MPTISVDKYDLFEALGQKYTTEEFEALCFEFGIELDEDTENEERPIVNGEQEPPQLKIEIPANRYDMLCFEGIALMLKIFLQKQETPKFRLVEPASGQLQTITVSEDTTKVRPLVAGAILRNVKFTKKRYESFIALQDKLHQNLARQRTLVAIGTHDLDTLQGPFTYEALAPKDIKFTPLNQTKEMNAEELMEFYDKDRHLGKFLHIIRDKPVYPVIYDSKRTVCSLPPIINGDHSKITVDSKNVFIECTATDATKLDIVINMMVTMFSAYAEEPFTIEPIKIVSEHNNQTRVTPNLESRTQKVEIDYLNACLGLSEPVENICKLLTKMALSAKPSSETGMIDVSIPPTRADILQRCDVMEDLGIAYGFNKLPRMSVTKTVGAPLTMNKLADIVRLESGMAGWSEVMPLILCSHDENFAWLNRKDDGKTCVRLANPKTAEYQIVRTSLVPGLLKTIRENKYHSVPMKVFETSDVVFKDESLERKARNERHFSAAWYGKTSGFEEVHGLLDRVMLMLRQGFLTSEEGLATEKSLDFEVREDHTKRDGYWLEPIEEPTFFPGRAAAVYLRLDGKAKRIGEFGILHPTVLENFELRYPVSTLEINLEVFL
ncbi:phenylalanyl-tRNA synthetase [Microdochium bolleyi]|uniref:Phenylalanine--tRNA ligase beta subunit n=1 Tax=Microdochium bolleyi TaxID=196109 RepID=A0A136JBC6_9PEZI|nr:phenylalanyl-tRNA synthetase [Microdochium bolleyi]